MVGGMKCWLATVMLMMCGVGLAAPVPAKPVVPYVAAPAKAEFDTILRVQIYLDGQMFGPGKVDGRIGEFTRKAVAAWNVAHGVADPDNWYEVLLASRKGTKALWAAYRVKKEDYNFVTPDLPEKPVDQAKRKFMGYRSLGELLAERYHTTEEFVAAINPGLAINSLKAGAIVHVPNVEPFLIEAVPKNAGFKADPLLSARQVLVDTAEKTAAFYNEKGNLFALFPITPGPREKVKYGEWKIEVMITTPEFRYDKKMLDKGVRGKEFYTIPPGPNCPVGVLWAGLSASGIGLHGTASPETIGRSQSAGCIRLANWDAIRLSRLVRPGTKVWVK